MTVMAQKKNNMKKGPFKLKSGNRPSIAKLAGVSPTKAMEVLVDGIPSGTGAEARDKAARQEAINRTLAQKGKESMEVGGEKFKTRSVQYTGADALAKAKADGADARTIRAIRRGELGTKENPYSKGARKNM